MPINYQDGGSANVAVVIVPAPANPQYPAGTPNPTVALGAKTAATPTKADGSQKPSSGAKTTPTPAPATRTTLSAVQPPPPDTSHPDLDKWITQHFKQGYTEAQIIGEIHNVFHKDWSLAQITRIVESLAPRKVATPIKVSTTATTGVNAPSSGRPPVKPETLTQQIRREDRQGWSDDAIYRQTKKEHPNWSEAQIRAALSAGGIHSIKVPVGRSGGSMDAYSSAGRNARAKGLTAYVDKSIKKIPGDLVGVAKGIKQQHDDASLSNLRHPIRLVKHDYRDVKGMVVSTVTTVRHPLRDPFMTAVLAAPFLKGVRLGAVDHGVLEPRLKPKLSPHKGGEYGSAADHARAVVRNEAPNAHKPNANSGFPPRWPKGPGNHRPGGGLVGMPDPVNPGSHPGIGKGFLHGANDAETAWLNDAQKAAHRKAQKNIPQNTTHQPLLRTRAGSVEPRSTVTSGEVRSVVKTYHAIGDNNLPGAGEAARSSSTHEHVTRTVAIAVALAKSLGYTPEQIRIVARAMALHDLGKTVQPYSSLLQIPERLDDAQFEIMKGHVQAGLYILDELGIHDPFVRAVVGEHHWWDVNLPRKGYPNQGSFPPQPISQIAKVADAYEAMTDNRPYRAAMPWAEALDTIKRGSINEGEGREFSPLVALRLEKLLAKKPWWATR